MRIGTYDSRAVALAFYNSDPHRQALKAMKEEILKARAAGNEKQAIKLEAQMPMVQARMHWQVFSNISAPNVITGIADELPDIARAAGVSAIVSRWELVFADDSIEYVDVTPQLTALFDPSDRVRKWIADLNTRTPIPLDELPLESDY